MDCAPGNLLALAVALISLAAWAWLLFVRQGDIVPHPESERSDAALAPGPGPVPSHQTAPALCRAFVAAHDALAGAGFEVVTARCEAGAALPCGTVPLTLAFTVRAGPEPGDAAEPDGARDAPGAPGGGRAALALWLAETLASLRAGPRVDPPPTRRRVELRDADCDAGCGVPALRLALPDGSSRWLRVGREAAGAAGRLLAEACCGSPPGRLRVAEAWESNGVWTLLLDDGGLAVGRVVVPEEAGRAAREMLGGDA